MGNPTLICTSPGQAIFSDEPNPVVEKGTFLVRGIYSAISTGTEMTLYWGDFPPDSVWARLARYPIRLGYSHLGEVVEVGEGVENVAVGDRIVGWKYHSLFHLYRWDEEWARVPEGVSDEAAAVFALAVISLNGVRRAKVQLGEKVIVFGLGPIGLFACHFCRMAGGRPVIGVDILSERRAYAVQSGAVDVALDPTQADFAEQVKGWTKGRLADVVFEASGHARALLEAVQVVRRQGRLILLSSPRQRVEFDFHDWCNWNSLSIIGAHTSSHPPNENPDDPWTRQRNLELYFDLIGRGEIMVDKMITHRFPWTQLPDVYTFLNQNRGKTGIVLIDWRDGIV